MTDAQHRAQMRLECLKLAAQMVISDGNMCAEYPDDGAAGPSQDVLDIADALLVLVFIVDTFVPAEDAAGD